MSSSQIFCPNCDALVPAEHININAMAAKCDDCDHVFQLPQSPTKRNSASSTESSSSSFDEDLLDFKGRVPARPKSLTKETGPGGELYIRKRWFTPALFGLLFFCIAWDSFLVFWYTMAFTDENAPWIMVIFPIAHVAVGVGLTYSVIAGFLNKTHLFADRHTVIVSHRPLPWFGNREADAHGIKSISLQRSASGDSDRPSLKYKLLANNDGEEIELLGSLDRSEARYIAFELANQLKCDLA